MVGQSVIDILHAISPFVVVGAVGLPILFASVRLARWRTRRVAQKAGMTVVEYKPIVVDPHMFVVTSRDGVRHVPRPATSHRQR